MTVFYDTYAMIEMVRQNPQYATYLEEEFATTVFNLVELYTLLRRDFNEEVARSSFFRFKEGAEEVEDLIIFKAGRLKLSNKNLSYADCIGYSYAREKNIVFLTGDRGFKDLPGVQIIR